MLRDAYDGTSFEEYFELLRIRYPGVDRWTALRNAPSRGVSFPDVDLGQEPQQFRSDFPVTTWIERAEEVRLDDVPLRENTSRVCIERVKQLSHLEHLAQWVPPVDSLVITDAIRATTTSDTDAVPLQLVDLQHNTAQVVEAVLSVTSPEILVLLDNSDVVDLRWLREPRRLRSATIYDTIENVDTLRNAHAIETLKLGEVAVTPSWRGVLESIGGNLTRLEVHPARPSSPEELLGSLTKLPHLRRLTVPAWQDVRSSWLAFAVNHPNVAVDFSEPPKAPEIHEVTKRIYLESYREIDIVKLDRGSKPRYQVVGDLAAQRADIVASWKGDNGDLEDALRALSLIHISEPTRPY